MPNLIISSILEKDDHLSLSSNMIISENIKLFSVLILHGDVELDKMKRKEKLGVSCTYLLT